MGAYNGRLMPRSVFGMPLEAVVLSSISFCCLVLMLSVQFNLLRIIFVLGFVLTLRRVNKILSSGSLVVIVKALKEEDNIKRINRLNRGSPIR